jgi:hypothetical protein
MILAPGRADQLLRVPFDQIEWPADTDADLDEPIAGHTVYPCCAICHAPRVTFDGYPSCPGAPMPYVAGVQDRPPHKPRPALCRLTRNAEQAARVPRYSAAQLARYRLASLITPERLRLLRVVYDSGATFEQLGRRYWRLFGYRSARSCADSIRDQFHREQFQTRGTGRRRRAA